MAFQGRLKAMRPEIPAQTPRAIFRRLVAVSARMLAFRTCMLAALVAGAALAAPPTLCAQWMPSRLPAARATARKTTVTSPIARLRLLRLPLQQQQSPSHGTPPAPARSSMPSALTHRKSARAVRASRAARASPRPPGMAA